MAATATPIPIEFRGSASEYFGIWIVNFLLSIVTFGIYSAWAKVRRLRYFRGNTYIAGDALDYHAQPITILKGRILVVVTIAALNGLSQFNPTFSLLWLVVLAALPWLLNRSLRFSARNTSWRAVRFDFRGDYGGGLVAFLLMPVVAMFSFGTLVPVATRVARTYFIRHHRFGTVQFDADIRLGPLYGALGLTVLFFLALAISLGAVLTAIVLAVGIGASYFQVLPIGVGFAAIIAMTFYFARARNIAISTMTLEGDHRFVSRLSGLRLAWIMASNAVAVIVTLGLATPWATVRSWRYQAEALALIPASDLSEFVDIERAAGPAFGEEFADLEGFEISF